MIIEVKQWPESQDVMHKDEWFFIMAGDSEIDPIGNSAYARIVYEGYDEGYQQYKRAFKEAQKTIAIAKDALHFLSGYPVRSLNYQYIASNALDKMDVSDKEETSNE